MNVYYIRRPEGMDCPPGAILDFVVTAPDFDAAREMYPDLTGSRYPTVWVPGRGWEWRGVKVTGWIDPKLAYITLVGTNADGPQRIVTGYIHH